ncbi:MAG TPA: cyclic nucleotide-binding domain-containing protein [Mycobacteriales bacterium]|jgi:CRP-like cAMP-binding protein|nr:cyclic nucleotide-binding domain-containing protein [Mycobacteriales bacterium]
MFRNDVHGVPTSRLEMLRRLPMFEHYSDEELTRVDALVYETTLPAGALLTIEGKVRRQAFIIVAGEATVAVGNRVVGRVCDGDLVGEMSLVNHRPQMATVTAQGPLRVLVMDPREFGTWLSDPRAARWLAGDLSEKQTGSSSRPATSPKPIRVPA